MRALLKLTVCLHEAVSKTCHCSCFQKNHVLKHFSASALPGDWQGLGAHGLTTGLLSAFLSDWFCISLKMLKYLEFKARKAAEWMSHSKSTKKSLDFTSDFHGNHLSLSHFPVIHQTEFWPLFAVGLFISKPVGLIMMCWAGRMLAVYQGVFQESVPCLRGTLKDLYSRHEKVKKSMSPSAPKTKIFQLISHFSIFLCKIWEAQLTS